MVAPALHTLVFCPVFLWPGKKKKNGFNKYFLDGFEKYLVFPDSISLEGKTRELDWSWGHLNQEEGK